MAEAERQHGVVSLAQLQLHGLGTAGVASERRTAGCTGSTVAYTQSAART